MLSFHKHHTRSTIPLVMALYISEGTLAFMLPFEIHNNSVAGVWGVVNSCNKMQTSGKKWYMTALTVLREK